jgi:hypothetical protein
MYTDHAEEDIGTIVSVLFADRNQRGSLCCAKKKVVPHFEDLDSLHDVEPTPYPRIFRGP